MNRVEGPKEKQQKQKKRKICFEFQNTGSCKFGDKCKFLHELAAANTETSPIESLSPSSEMNEKTTDQDQSTNQIDSSTTEDKTNPESRDWGQEYLNLFPSYLRREGGLICPIEPILQSPTLEGYRNKFEFTIGKNYNQQICVGFRVGLFKEGNITVESPSYVVFLSESSI